MHGYAVFGETTLSWMVPIPAQKKRLGILQYHGWFQWLLTFISDFEEWHGTCLRKQAWNIDKCMKIDIDGCRLSILQTVNIASHQLFLFHCLRYNDRKMKHLLYESYVLFQMKHFYEDILQKLWIKYITEVVIVMSLKYLFIRSVTNTQHRNTLLSQLFKPLLNTFKFNVNAGCKWCDTFLHMYIWTRIIQQFFVNLPPSRSVQIGHVYNPSYLDSNASGSL